MNNQHYIGHYKCPNCGLFDVIHSALDNVNTVCMYCGAKPHFFGVVDGTCQSCGRKFDDITQGKCPSDDCPSNERNWNGNAQVSKLQ